MLLPHADALHAVLPSPDRRADQSWPSSWLPHQPPPLPNGPFVLLPRPLPGAAAWCTPDVQNVLDFHKVHFMVITFIRTCILHHTNVLHEHHVKAALQEFLFRLVTSQPCGGF